MHEVVENFVFPCHDIAIVNSFILFKEHQAKNPDNEALHRTRDYSLSSFQEEIVRQLCNFPDYDEPPFEH